MERYGKSMKGVLKQNNHYFRENERWLENEEDLAKKYIEQPKRSECKICQSSLSQYGLSFTLLEVEYRTCSNCGHLNGMHEDTVEFVNYLHRQEADVEYSDVYVKENKTEYKQRLEDIYAPKVEFLFDALEERDERPQEMNYADFGAGSGYFVKALSQEGVAGVRGYESSENQMKYAEKMVDSAEFVNVSRSEIYDIGKNVTTDIVSLIFTLEHLRRPVDLLRNLRNNPSVQYVFLSVPMFSPCAYFELVFPSTAPRQFSGGHTHLFRESSIDYLCRELGFERVAEWWFGQDVLDLVRAVELETRRHSEGESAPANWRSMVDEMADDLQTVFDENKLSSEVHLLIESK